MRKPCPQSRMVKGLSASVEAGFSLPSDKILSLVQLFLPLWIPLAKPCFSMKKPLFFFAFFACLLPAASAQVVNSEGTARQLRIGSGAGLSLNLFNQANNTQGNGWLSVSPGLQFFPKEHLIFSASLPVLYSGNFFQNGAPAGRQRNSFSTLGLHISLGYYQPLGTRFYGVIRGNTEGQFQWWSSGTRQGGASSVNTGADFQVKTGASFHVGFRAWDRVFVETTVADLYAAWFPRANPISAGLTPFQFIQFSLSPIQSGISVYYQI